MGPMANGCGTFWESGRLSSLEQACLASFAPRGIDLTLFSYEPISNVPEGVRTADAEEIMPRATIGRVIYDGRPNLQHFSDLFRYEMIARRNLVWVDADILMIGALQPLPYPNVIVREEQGGLNNAVLYVSDAAILKSISEQAEALLDRDLRWGETGPGVVAAAVGEQLPQPALYDHTLFYPIEHYDVWKLFLPERRDECAEKCRSAMTLHLFNNILTTLGYWKDMAPPSGSFLHEKLEEAGALGYFRDTYPEKIMARVVDNFRLSQNGKGLGVKAIVRELVPSIRRTYRHYRK